MTSKRSASEAQSSSSTNKDDVQPIAEPDTKRQRLNEAENAVAAEPLGTAAASGTAALSDWSSVGAKQVSTSGSSSAGDSHRDTGSSFHRIDTSSFSSRPTAEQTQVNSSEAPAPSQFDFKSNSSAEVTGKAWRRVQREARGNESDESASTESGSEARLQRELATKEADRFDESHSQFTTLTVEEHDWHYSTESAAATSVSVSSLSGTANTSSSTSHTSSSVSASGASSTTSSSSFSSSSSLASASSTRSSSSSSSSSVPLAMSSGLAQLLAGVGRERSLKSSMFDGYVRRVDDNFVSDVPTSVPGCRTRIYEASRRFDCSYAEAQGMRDSMEDTMVIHGQFAGRADCDLFALFDGHGSASVARDAAPVLVAALLERLQNEPSIVTNASADSVGSPVGSVANDAALIDTLRRCLIGAFNDADAKVIEEAAGTTVVLALFWGDILLVANCGDSRAVIGGRRVAPLRLTEDHKPTIEREKTRIEAQRGFVARGRVCSILSVSRSLGDRFLSPMVTAVPDVFCVREWQHCDVLVLGCDGVFDVLSDTQVIEMALNVTDVSQAATTIRDAALEAYSTDNVSCIVVGLHDGAKSSSSVSAAVT